MQSKNILAGITAALTWAALVLQFALLVERMMENGASFGAATWRYFGFFTILINIGVAVVATAMVLRPDSALAGPKTRFVVLTCIVFVGIVYSVALRAMAQFTGWDAVANHALHDAAPVLFFITWVFSEHVSLRWKDALWALLPPLAYCFYAFVRGAFDRWYAYWFLDPTTLSFTHLMASIALLLVAFLCLAFAVIALDRWLASRHRIG